MVKTAVNTGPNSDSIFALSMGLSILATIPDPGTIRSMMGVLFLIFPAISMSMLDLTHSIPILGL